MLIVAGLIGLIASLYLGLSYWKLRKSQYVLRSLLIGSLASASIIAINHAGGCCRWGANDSALGSLAVLAMIFSLRLAATEPHRWISEWLVGLTLILLYVPVSFDTSLVPPNLRYFEGDFSVGYDFVFLANSEYHVLRERVALEALAWTALWLVSGALSPNIRFAVKGK